MGFSDVIFLRFLFELTKVCQCVIIVLVIEMEIKLEDLEKAIKAGGNDWSIQNNNSDMKTKFIYDVKDFNKLQTLCNCALRSDEDRKYAYHRWVNFHSSIYCEQLFCKYGAEKVENYKDKEKDIFINGVAYDVKLSVYPAAFINQYDLDVEDNKEKIIKWLYKNQSKEGRSHFKNRLFIVCCGETKEERMKKKTDFVLIEEKIREWMKKNVQKKIVIEGANIEYEVYSDIINIK